MFYHEVHEEHEVRQKNFWFNFVYFVNFVVRKK